MPLYVVAGDCLSRGRLRTAVLLSTLLIQLLLTLAPLSSARPPARLNVIAQTRYLEVYRGQNITEIINNASEPTVLLVHEGGYAVGAIACRAPIAIRPYGWSYVHLVFLGTIRCGNITLSNLYNVTFRNTTLYSSNLSLYNITVLSIEGLTAAGSNISIEESVIEELEAVMANGSSAYIASNTIYGGAVYGSHVSAYNASSITLAGNNIFGIKLEINGGLGLLNISGNTIRGSQHYIGPESFPLIVTRSPATVERIYIAGNRLGIRLETLIRVEGSPGETGLGDILVLDNYIEYFNNTLTAEAPGPSRIRIGNLYFINNYAACLLPGPALFIDASAYNSSGIAFGSLVFIGNSFTTSPNRPENYTKKLLRLGSHGGSWIRVGGLHVYANMFFAVLIEPAIDSSGNATIGETVFTSPYMIEYLYDGRRHRGFIGNYFGYLRLAGYSYIDADGDGISDTPVSYGGLYRDTGPIYFVDARYSVVLVNRTHVKVGVPGCYAVYGLPDVGLLFIHLTYMLADFNWSIYGLQNMDGEKLRIGEIYDEVLFGLYRYGDIIVVVDALFHQVDHGGPWINITARNQSNVSIYLDGYTITYIDGNTTPVQVNPQRVAYIKVRGEAHIHLARLPTLPAEEPPVIPLLLLMACAIAVVGLARNHR